MADAPKPAWNPAAAWTVTLLLAVAACVAARQTASPAPLGLPMPIPQPFITTKGVGNGDTDFLGRRMAPVWLEFLAPQPDGTIPLRYPYGSDRGGFNISHPEGALLVEEPMDYFNKTNIDAECYLSYNQPIKQIRYVFPQRQGAETVTDFVARTKYELAQKGSKLVPGHSDRLEQKRYRFEHFEYVAQEDSGPVYHVWYVGPLGTRVLIIDFATTEQLIDVARPQINKILASFKPRRELSQVMLMEDPTYGEWAGTSEVDEALKLKAEWDEQAKQQAAASGTKPGPTGR